MAVGRVLQWLWFTNTDTTKENDQIKQKEFKYHKGDKIADVHSNEVKISFNFWVNAKLLICKILYQSIATFVMITSLVSNTKLHNILQNNFNYAIVHKEIRTIIIHAIRH